MKFKAPPLSTGKRATLERTAKWLLNLVSELDAKKASLDEVTRALEAAEGRKAKAEKDAALNPDAALTLAGAEAQLSRLAPEVKQQRQSLERQTATALQQVNLALSTEVRELLFGPLSEQLIASIGAAISPFCEAGSAHHIAKQIIQQNRCPQYRQILFYLNRQLSGQVEFEDAKREINAFVEELNRILAGETLLEA